MNILIINGPNLNLIGNREPGIYGNQNMDDYIRQICEKFHEDKITYFQSNIEGEIVNTIQYADKIAEGLIINAGAYTHTSLSIADAIRNLSIPVIEVHISNIYARETLRHKSLIAKNCSGSIVGLGLEGYGLAVKYLRDKYIKKQD